MERTKALAVCGSLRNGSYNRKLLGRAIGIAREAGAEIEEIDLRALDLPLYDADIEERGMPPAVAALKEKIAGCAALLIASPEYNYSVSGALKNMIDWCSRGGNAFKGKWAAVFGASTGPYGTLRGQLHLRQVLGSVNVLVLPQPQVMVAHAHDAFAGDGGLKDEKLGERLERLVRRTLEEAARRGAHA